jgi:hypothetical protein
MSERRPTRRNPTAEPSVYTGATQLIFGDGPISSLMRDLETISIVFSRRYETHRVFAGKTQPKYAQILAQHTAWYDQSRISLQAGMKTHNHGANKLHTVKVSPGI